jgi:hypothetical protein
MAQKRTKMAGTVKRSSTQKDRKKMRFNVLL